MAGEITPIQGLGINQPSKECTGKQEIIEGMTEEKLNYLVNVVKDVVSFQPTNEIIEEGLKLLPHQAYRDIHNGGIPISDKRVSEKVICTKELQKFYLSKLAELEKVCKKHNRPLTSKS
jgi:hypothetical protein